ncbi:MAG: phosphoglycerate kinase [archaeon]
MFSKLKDYNYKDKKVLIRVDFNVPIQQGIIADDTRIRKALPTIDYILKKKPAQLIIISHLGRPDGEYKPEFSLKPVCVRLQEILGQEVYFEPNPRIISINSLPQNKILMLENLRFDKAEESGDDDFAKKLSEFCDIFVLDAFGACHRPHASISVIQKYVTSCAGFLMEKEIKFLRDSIKRPKRPFVAIIGGAKADKIDVIDKLIQKVDALIIGGVLANTFLKAKNISIGNSKVSDETLEYAKNLLEKYPEKIHLPVDYILADRFAADARTRCAGLPDNIDGWMIMDIGPYTISGYNELLSKSNTILWAGPIGVFEWESFRRGTWDIASHLAEISATKIICGGDSGEAIEKFHLAERMTHVSTGGGASLELLAGNDLPGISALEANHNKFKK